MSNRFGQEGFTDSVSGVWTPYGDVPSNEPGWIARDAEVAELHAQIAGLAPADPDRTPAAPAVALLSDLDAARAEQRAVDAGIALRLGYDSSGTGLGGKGISDAILRSGPAAVEVSGTDEPTVFEYRLAYLDGDLIHPGSTVRGPEAHAIEVWNSRRDPANESTYGPDIKLQRRPMIEWDDFRVPTAEDRRGCS